MRFSVRSRTSPFAYSPTNSDGHDSTSLAICHTRSSGAPMTIELSVCADMVTSLDGNGTTAARPLCHSRRRRESAVVRLPRCPA